MIGKTSYYRTIGDVSFPTSGKRQNVRGSARRSGSALKGTLSSRRSQPERACQTMTMWLTMPSSPVAGRRGGYRLVTVTESRSLRRVTRSSRPHRGPQEPWDRRWSDRRWQRHAGRQDLHPEPRRRAELPAAANHDGQGLGISADGPMTSTQFRISAMPAPVLRKSPARPRAGTARHHRCG